MAKNQQFVIVGIYVDDLIIVGNNNGKIQKLKSDLSKELEMVDLKTPRMFLGVEIVQCRKEGVIFIHKKRFTRNT